MKNNMNAAIFLGEGNLDLMRVPKPGIVDSCEVLLKVEAASICGTDVHILSVPPGHPANKNVILGHEYTGKVVEVGSSIKHLKVGDRVVVDPNLKCGICQYCRIGLDNMCENMTTLGIFINGGFAEYNVAPAKALHKIPSQLPSEIAVFAEPLSCVLNGIRKIKPQVGENVIILGAGPIGLLYTAIMKSSGVGKIIVVEINEFRANFAKQMGANLVVNPKEKDLEEIIKSETEIGADIVIDAVGSLVVEAINFVRRGGRILLFGMNSKAYCNFHQYDVTRKEITIFGTYISNFTFPDSIKLLVSGVLPLEKLITHRFPLTEVLKGIEVMRKGEGIEVIIIPS